MYNTRIFAKIFAVTVLATVAAYAQDKITVLVQRGTTTKTAVIDSSSATDAMKALDYLVATSCSAPGVCEYANETDAIRKHLVSWVLQQLVVTPGTAIKAANDSVVAAQKVLDKAKSDYQTAAQATAIQ